MGAERTSRSGRRSSMVDAQHGAQFAAGAHDVALNAYVPGWVRRTFRNWEQDAAPRARPSHGAILFLDLVGFSKHTASLASVGPKGAEDLSIILNRVFAGIADIISRRQG